MDNNDFKFLDSKRVIFEKNENGFCSMKYGQNEYKRVRLLRACPTTEKHKYICVQDMQSNEIGIIEDLKFLDPKSAENAMSELDKCYFTPEITEFLDIKMRPGATFFDCMFSDRKKSFVVKDVSHNIFYIAENLARINDADGNRYVFKTDKLNRKSKKLIEPLLY